MDAIGKALFAMDEAAAEMGRSRERETADLCNMARDVAAAARRWNRDDPERAAMLILESVFDEVLDGPAWRFLAAAVKHEFLPPAPYVRAMLKATAEATPGTDWFRLAHDIVTP